MSLMCVALWVALCPVLPKHPLEQTHASNEDNQDDDDDDDDNNNNDDGDDCVRLSVLYLQLYTFLAANYLIHTDDCKCFYCCWSAASRRQQGWAPSVITPPPLLFTPPPPPSQSTWEFVSCRNCLHSPHSCLVQFRICMLCFYPV